MKAFAQPLETPSYTIRVGPECEKYGDPFDLSVTIDGGPHNGEIVGLSEHVTTAHRRAIFATAKDIGFRRIHYTIKGELYEHKL